ncbi:Peptidyl-prolyl cis-trans isomerase fkbp8 [Nowakowskiella sp. JEL0078]|nr:Peptidyl-prolyl cis-trans isomerase fkbp8 [Nowakowskiella sp. JEL0078]
MLVGEKSEFICDTSLGYGEIGNLPEVPPNSNLRFVVEVLSQEVVRKSISDMISQSETLKEEGNKSFSLQDFSSAISSYTAALDSISDTWGAEIYESLHIQKLKVAVNSNLAAVYLKTDQLKEAIVSCENALFLEPDNLKVLLRLAKAKSGLGEADVAVDVLKRALKANPSDAELIEKEIARVSKLKILKIAEEKQMYSRMFS